MVALNSCTSALTLALKLCDVMPDDEIIATSMTCVASNTPIHTFGAKVVWADINHTTGNIEPDNIEKLKKLKLQIQKLQKIGGLDAIVPSEGIVFKYKGKVYKFTGAFAPINQILGSIKFG